MITNVVSIDSMPPAKDKILQVVGVLRAGGIAGVPTETVFGLACNKNDKGAVKKLYDIKNRPADKFFVIQITGADALARYQAHVTPDIKDILNRFWPGPLTVILNTEYGSTGFRVPDNRTTLSIIREADFPIAVTSANYSGGKELACAEDVRRVFDGKIDVVVDDKTKAKGIVSTVLDCTRTPFKILRKGLIAKEISRDCPNIEEFL